MNVQRTRNLIRLLVLAVLWPCAVTSAAEEGPTPATPTDSKEKLQLNLDTKTFGGKQFWTDELVFHDWRVQRNAISGHFRLLDDKNVRKAWGTYAECEQALGQCKTEQQMPPLQRKVVLVLHGLIRSRDSMEGLLQYLRQDDDVTVLNVSYASTRAKVADHAAALAKVIERLEGVEEISFVGHSLGNIVVRHYLNDRSHQVHGERRVPRIGRIVMLGPPNNGTEMARRFQDNSLFKTFWGVSGKELANEWNTLQEHLCVPEGEFGIIAGGTGDEKGHSPLLAGDDDFVVSVEETKLPGAADFLVRPVLHTTMMDDKTVQECTLRFLQHGYFIAPEDRLPIPRVLASAKP